MPDSRRSAILVIEDFQENIDFLKTILDDQYDVFTALSGEDGLDMLNSGGIVIDLILLDIMMPGMSGYEVIQRLKKKNTTRHIPVIFLTAKSETEDIEKGFALGAMDYVTKPYNPLELMARVKTHIKLKRSMDKLQLINLAVSKAADESDAKVDFLVERVKKILERQNNLQQNLQTVQKFISLLAINDLGNLKIVEKILEKSDPIIQTIIKEPTPEEEYFRVLSLSIEPLKTAISDIESVIRSLMLLGIITPDELAAKDINDTTFFVMLQNIYQTGKLSLEKYKELMETAQFDFTEYEESSGGDGAGLFFFD